MNADSRQWTCSRRSFLAGAAGGALGFSALRAVAAEPSLRPAAELVIDPEALNFPKGPWGTCINGQTFQEQAVATFRGYQYAVYFHASGRLALTRRKLPDGPWQRILFDYRIAHHDVHNVAVLGLCPGDGTIHLAFDHHCHPLRYRVSKPGAATEPERVQWTADLFGPTTDSLVPGQRLASVTYPMFMPAPDDRLMLFYRIGGSGNGDWYLTHYDPAASRWAEPIEFLGRGGTYQGSTSRCGYPNGVQYDDGGRLHATWCWRETPDVKTNHDLAYAYSDDAGQTWKNNAGQTVGRAGKQPITVETPGIVVATIPFGWGMMNQLTQDIDTAGHVHTITWQNPPDATAPSPDYNAWRYVHHWRDPAGTWHHRVLPFFGRKPRLVVDPAGDAWMVFKKGPRLDYHGYDHGGRLHVARATAASLWTDWRVVYASDRDYVGEPRVDLLRWRAERALSIYVQQKPQAPGVPSPLWLVEFPLPPGEGRRAAAG